jgi:hypothetical protein
MMVALGRTRGFSNVVNRALHPLKKQVIEIAAPKARNMKARGKREARRPWFINMRRSGLKGRNILRVLRPFRAGWNFDLRTRGDALCACPWLSYLAPLALHHITFISRAFGAALHHFHIPRPWRCITSLSYSAPLALHYLTLITTLLLATPRKLRLTSTSPAFASSFGNLRFTCVNESKFGTLPTYSISSGYGP